MTSLKRNFFKYFECFVWSGGLLLLGCMNPTAEQHFSLCVFKWMGFSFCPGCGLGHSISWLFRGQVMQSFQTHPLGIFALAILLHRIYMLIFKNKSSIVTT